jgi:hypothetical protein
MGIEPTLPFGRPGKRSQGRFWLFFIKIIRYKIIFRNGVCEEIVSFENKVMLLTD